MTDTNKEREIERLESSLINYVSHLSDTPKRARKVAEILVELGYGFLGDRVGQTFTEEGFRAWWKERGFPVITENSWFDLAAEYAATLQPQQTMGREEIKDVLWRIESELHGLEHREQHESDYDLIADALLGKLPATSHPVEGELTHEKYIGFLNLYAEDDSECVAQAESGLWQAILSERAATEARVRDQEAAKYRLVRKDWEDAYKEMAELKATIADLTEKNAYVQEKNEHFGEVIANQIAEIAALNAKLETTVQIPPVEEWRPGVEELVICAYDQNGIYQYALGHFPRPTPKTLTSEEKAEAVMRSMGYDPDSDIGRAAGESALYKAMLDGKSIDELYAEVKGE